MSHIPVLANEVIDSLNISDNKVFFDGTLGGAGHSQLILAKLNNTGHLYSFDRDAQVIANFAEEQAENWTRVHANFAEIYNYADKHSIQITGALLLDLGLSSIQLDDYDRGFSFNSEAPLDMRMDRSSELSAASVINFYSEEDMANIFYEYGEEHKSRQIARAIFEARPLHTCKELSEIIKKIYIRSYGPAPSRTHPATKVFQALRIYVNAELEALQSILDFKPQVFTAGARIAIISFHSLEDRMVKNLFRKHSISKEARSKYAKPEALTGELKLKILTNKPILASPEEIKINPRARSAKLRVAEFLLS